MVSLLPVAPPAVFPVMVWLVVGGITSSPAVFPVPRLMVWWVVGGVTSPPAIFPVPCPMVWSVVGGVTSPPAIFPVPRPMVWSVVGGVTSPPAVFPVPRPMVWSVVGGVTSPPANRLAASSEGGTLTSDLCRFRDEAVVTVDVLYFSAETYVLGLSDVQTWYAFSSMHTVPRVTRYAHNNCTFNEQDTLVSRSCITFQKSGGFGWSNFSL